MEVQRYGAFPLDAGFLGVHIGVIHIGPQCPHAVDGFKGIDLRCRNYAGDERALLAGVDGSVGAGHHIGCAERPFCPRSGVHRIEILGRIRTPDKAGTSVADGFDGSGTRLLVGRGGRNLVVFPMPVCSRLRGLGRINADEVCVDDPVNALRVAFHGVVVLDSFGIIELPAVDGPGGVFAFTGGTHVEYDAFPGSGEILLFLAGDEHYRPQRNQSCRYKLFHGSVPVMPFSNPIAHRVSIIRLVHILAA